MCPLPKLNQDGINIPKEIPKETEAVSQSHSSLKKKDNKDNYRWISFMKNDENIQ